MIKLFVASDGERREVEIEEGETAREARYTMTCRVSMAIAEGYVLARPVMCMSIPNGSTRWVGLCMMEWRPTSCSSPKAPLNTVALPVRFR